MKTCSMNDFLKELSPWLDRKYISEARMDGEERIVLVFQDGVREVFDITDCTREQARAVLNDLAGKGVTVVP